MVGPLLAPPFRSPSSACRLLLLLALPSLLSDHSGHPRCCILRGKEVVVMILVFDLRAILPLLFRLFPVVRLIAPKPCVCFPRVTSSQSMTKSDFESLRKLI